MLERGNMTKPKSPILPSGTVTFLFTDMEGSTRLLHQLGDGYADILAGQRDIVRAAFAKFCGREVDTQGDAFFAAFPRAREAAAAAVEIQRNLVACKWPEGVTVKVRMGLHTGEPIVAEEGYVGLDVHRASRIAHVGHGGQVLLSESTVALVRDQLPEGVSLRSLGEHRLKDLSRSEAVFQLVIPGLQTDFPPLSSLDAQPHNLPVQLTTFVGRQVDIEAVRDLLQQSRLVSLLGPGGMGKTRLSLQVAASLVDQFPHGVWFVELASISAPEQIVPAIAAAMRFNIDVHSSDLDPRRQLIDFLGSRSLMILLDNFEHLVHAAHLLTEILENAPQVKVLATSRERLGLREEWVYYVGGLGALDQEGGVNADQDSSLDLFWERARQEQASFSLNGEERQAAVRICRLVEGMPLGIELAAAWVSLLSCREIAEEIQNNLDFLATSLRGVPDKHRSLRAIFDTSWQRIPPAEQDRIRPSGTLSGRFYPESGQRGRQRESSHAVWIDAEIPSAT